MQASGYGKWRIISGKCGATLPPGSINDLSVYFNYRGNPNRSHMPDDQTGQIACNLVSFLKELWTIPLGKTLFTTPVHSMSGHHRMSIVDWQPSNVVYIIESSMPCGSWRSIRRAAFDYPIWTVSIDTEPPPTFIIFSQGMRPMRRRMALKRRSARRSLKTGSTRKFISQMSRSAMAFSSQSKARSWSRKPT